MFDVFYTGKKPNIFPHERAVNNVEQAQQLSRTRYCWIINYLTDYTDFDFLYEPVPWESNQAHVWPSQHQENGGTWLVPKQGIFSGKCSAAIPLLISAGFSLLEMSGFEQGSGVILGRL